MATRLLHQFSKASLSFFNFLRIPDSEDFEFVYAFLNMFHIVQKLKKQRCASVLLFPASEITIITKKYQTAQRNEQLQIGAGSRMAALIYYTNFPASLSCSNFRWIPENEYRHHQWLQRMKRKRMSVSAQGVSYIFIILMHSNKQLCSSKISTFLFKKKVKSCSWPNRWATLSVVDPRLYRIDCNISPFKIEIEANTQPQIQTWSCFESVGIVVITLI